MNPVKVAVDRIKQEPTELKETIPAKEWGMDSFDIEFVDDILIDCKLRRIDKEIITDTEVRTYRNITCSRCLEQVRQEVKQNFKKYYNIDNLGEYLDLDKDIREEVLLNFPMKVLCKPDCKGICPKCGVNLNQQECKCEKIKINPFQG